uniref:Uncharacterized protein n=1 Tax=Rhizophora mucronata TaxID=61149 RepID=A0A2P2Q9Q7_RHIMU
MDNIILAYFPCLHLHSVDNLCFKVVSMLLDFFPSL